MVVVGGREEPTNAQVRLEEKKIRTISITCNISIWTGIPWEIPFYRHLRIRPNGGPVSVSSGAA
jgi:hypothetical protein